MATNSYVQVPPDSTGKKLHALQHTVDAVAVQVQGFHLVDVDNPGFVQSVDALGQASVRFAEGSPSMDAFGNLRVSSAHCLGYYDNVSGAQDDLFYTETTGTAAATLGDSYLTLSVGSANNDRILRKTTRHHFYQPGIGNLVIQTLALGDTGKVNSVRRWGYGDENNGMYWELDSAWDNVNMNHFFACIRSDVGGSVVENRVARANWNGDKIDGTGYSGFQLTLNGRMFYWIDFAWLGVGPVRFGVLGPNGERIVCHTFRHPAGDPVPYTRTASLPLFYEMKNVGVTSGTSEMRSICAAVYAETKPNYNFYSYADIESGAVTVTADTPVVSLRPKLTFGGMTNRTGTYPRSLSVMVTGGNAKLSIVEGGGLTGATWGISGEGSTEGDAGATAATGTHTYHSWYLAEGAHNIDVTDLYDTNDEGYHVAGDGLSSQIMTLLATKLSGTTVTVRAAITYRELR